MKKSVAPLLILSSILGGSSNEPEGEVKTDKEGMKKYLLKQSKLAENNKTSKRKLRKMKGRK